MNNRFSRRFGAAAIVLLAGVAAHAQEYHWIVTTNQATNQIEAYDPVNYGNWNTTGAMRWSFKPTSGRGYSSAEISAWGGPSDVKLRGCSAYSGTQPNVLVTCAGTLVTVASYPSGNRQWAVTLASGDNPHSTEILPNGNVAVAASAGGYVRVYAASQGPHNTTHAQFNLLDAHGVLWDPSRNRLWVTGQIPGGVYVVTALVVGGTAASPTLTEDTTLRANTPTAYTHSLYPYYYDTNLLWLSANAHGYVFNKTTKTFTVLPGAADNGLIKGLSNQPAGQIVEIFPKSGSCYTWTTDTVHFYDINSGALVATRQVNGACFYKALVWWWAYQ